MASPLQGNQETRYTALSMGSRQFTGLWTQRSPYRDADVPYLQGKFYGASRYDSILDGINREITSRLTDQRRPGSSVWNNMTFSAVLGFYSFKYIQSGVEVVRVMVDTATAVYDATGGNKTLIFTKSAGAGPTRFLAIGTTLYMANGVDSVKWVRSPIQWTAATSYSEGQYIVDSNNNLQLALGSQTATITNIQIVFQTRGALNGSLLTLYFDPNTPLEVVPTTALALSGLTTVPVLNGTTNIVDTVNSGTQINFFVYPALPVTAFSAETGAATTGNGISGGTQPVWLFGLGQVTQDGGAQWENRGSAVQQWMYPAPTVAPTVTQSPAPSIYPGWVANTWYGNPLVIIDSNGNGQQLTTSGTTGGAHPAWAVVKGTTTADNTAVWTCLGSATWAGATAYSLGALIQTTFTYTITTGQSVPYPPYVIYTTHQVTVTLAFQCVVAGTSGANAPNWGSGSGTQTQDGTVTWVEVGNAPTWPGAAALMTTANKILDSNGNIEVAQVTAKSDAAVPTWKTDAGSYTPDNTLNWLNAGPYSPANTGAWIYAYSGRNSITGDVTTASPVSQPITVSASNLAVIQGNGVQDQFDEIYVWRTAQGKSTLIFLDVIPNPGPTAKWIYTDTTPDTGLNALISAPVALANEPPPTGMTAPVYHLGRVWAVVNNQVVYSDGPDTLVGNGNDAFPPLNNIPYPAKVIRLLPVTVNNGGLLVWTTSGVWVVLGTGTASNPFYTTIFEPSVGISGWTALDVLGATPYFMENNGKVSSFDPQNGYTEIGFPIGDQFKKVTTGSGSASTGTLYNPATAYVSWNIQSSGETAMYVSDGAVGWFRFSPIAPPESGSLWSPRAAILCGTSAVQSVETSPGVFSLLIGPASSGPILQRDTTGTIWRDWVSSAYQPYPSWTAKGVTLLCTTGQVAEIAWIATKSTATGARPTVSLLLGEIAVTASTPWDVLQVTNQDPADLPPSITVYSDQYNALQNGVAPKSDSVLTKFDYGAQAYGDELLEFAIYGAKDEMRKM